MWCEEAPVPPLRLRRPAGLVPRAIREHHEIPAAVLRTHMIYFFIERKLQNESLPFCGESLNRQPSGAVSADPAFPWAERLRSEGGESSSIASRLHSLKCKYFI